MWPQCWAGRSPGCPPCRGPCSDCQGNPKEAGPRTLSPLLALQRFLCVPTVQSIVVTLFSLFPFIPMTGRSHFTPLSVSMVAWFTNIAIVTPFLFHVPSCFGWSGWDRLPSPPCVVQFLLPLCVVKVIRELSSLLPSGSCKATSFTDM